jgi:DNA-binding transcriptional LysR family regulator
VVEISLDQVKTFCAFVENKGYLRAAEALNKSHSAVVYAINCLEEQCGFALLDRSGYRSRLTGNGQRVYEKCSHLMAAAGDLESLCRDLNDDWETTVKIVYDGVLSTDPFLQILKLFDEQKSPSRIQIFSDFLDGVEQTFEKVHGQIMVSVTPPLNVACVSYALSPAKSVLVAHADHPISQHKSSWRMDELMDFHFLTVRGADHNLQLGTKELEESTAFRLSDFSLKKEAIMKKMGFGWLPERMITRELKSRELRLVKWERSSTQHLHPHVYHRKNEPLGRAGQMVLRQLLKVEVQCWPVLGGDNHLGAIDKGL